MLKYLTFEFDKFCECNSPRVSFFHNKKLSFYWLCCSTCKKYFVIDPMQVMVAFKQKGVYTSEFADKEIFRNEYQNWYKNEYHNWCGESGKNNANVVNFNSNRIEFYKNKLNRYLNQVSEERFIPEEKIENEKVH